MASIRLGSSNWIAAGAMVLLGFTAQGVRADRLKDGVSSDAKGTVIFTGVDTNPGSLYSFIGTIVAFNGDLGRDGFALRGYVGRSDFDLDPGNGVGWQTDLMLGYLFNRPSSSGGVFVGVDYKNTKLSPDDPTARERGTEIGAKVAANLTSSGDLPYHYSLHGAYSTAFDSYWARARTGFNNKTVTFGPEAIALGSASFDAYRLGGFATLKVELPHRTVEVTLSAGRHFLAGTNGAATAGSSGGGEGTYGSVVFAFVF